MKRRFIVFDTEDDSPEVMAAGKSGFEKKVTQIAALTSDGREYYSQGDLASFEKWIRAQNPEHIWAHMLQYDLGNLYGDSLDEIDATAIGNRIIRCNRGQLEYRDSLNIWPMALWKLGKAFNLPKLGGKIVAGPNGDEWVSDPNPSHFQSKKYVKRDVQITMKAVKFLHTMCAEYEIPKIPCTLGGLAVRIWKALGGKNWNNDWPFCRSAFFGGRVELFRHDVTGSLYWTDINSLYPYCMTKLFPVAANDMKDFDTGYGIAGITIKVPDCFVAPLPCRVVGDDKVIYPVGKISGIWTFHEIRNAVKHGAKVLSVHDAVGSKEGFPYYRDFVDHFYKLKKEATGAKELFYKLLLNNLYGQLATRGVITKTVSITDPRLKSGSLIFGSKAFLNMQTKVPPHVNVLHAAYVTSYGRLELFKYLQALGKRAIYCDTDGIIFEGKPSFECGKELGQMKLVMRGRHCVTHAPKMYQFDDIYKAKGVPVKYAKQFIKTGKAQYEQPFKYREAAQFFNRGNKKKLSVWRKVKKEFRTNYDKKRLDKSGYFWPKDFDKYCKECDK